MESLHPYHDVGNHVSMWYQTLLAVKSRRQTHKFSNTFPFEKLVLRDLKFGHS